jgi:hypothetical protein
MSCIIYVIYIYIHLYIYTYIYIYILYIYLFLREKGFILAPRVSGFSPWLLEQNILAEKPVVEALHFSADKKQKEDKEWPGRRFSQGPVLSDLLPPAKSHLLKFSETPKIAPPVGDRALKT